MRLGEGTCVRARKFGQPLPRGRRVGVYARPYPGETTSGDDAAFVRAGDVLVAAVVDGLGHGELAREAAEKARDVVYAQPTIGPDAILMRCHEELGRTRGAVMTVAALDEGRGEIRVASVGNVSAQLVGPGGTARFGGASSVLGAAGPVRRPVAEQRPVDRYDVLVLASDGVSSRLDLSDQRDLLREHPAVVAQRIVERFGRDNDDVTVLVVG